MKKSNDESNFIEMIDELKLNSNEYNRKNEIENSSHIEYLFDHLGFMNNDTYISHFLNLHTKKLGSYIIHKEIIYNQYVQSYIFIFNEGILITSKFENVNDDNEFSNSIIKKIDFFNIYDMDLEIVDNSKNIIIRLIQSNDFSSLVDVIFSFKLTREIFIIFHIIEKYKTLFWQKFFETKLKIPNSLIYQGHFFLKKANKRAKYQSRLIIFTNRFLFNVKFDFNISNGCEVITQNWALALESIKSISLIKNNNLTLKFDIDNTINTKIVEASNLKLKKTNKREFLFYYETDLKRFIFLCRRIYFNLKNNFLLINTIV